MCLLEELEAEEGSEGELLGVEKVSSLSIRTGGNQVWGDEECVSGGERYCQWMLCVEVGGDVGVFKMTVNW